MNNATEYPAAVRMGVMMANAWLRSFVSNSYYYIHTYTVNNYSPL